MAHERAGRIRSLLTWLCTFLGGGLFGVGLFMAAEVRVIRYLREEVGSLNAFERTVGRSTFLWRGLDEKLALALAEIPDDYLDQTRFVARVFMVAGPLALGVIVPLILRWRGRDGA